MLTKIVGLAFISFQIGKAWGRVEKLWDGMLFSLYLGLKDDLHVLSLSARFHSGKDTRDVISRGFAPDRVRCTCETRCAIEVIVDVSATSGTYHFRHVEYPACSEWLLDNRNM